MLTRDYVPLKRRREDTSDTSVEMSKGLKEEVKVVVNSLLMPHSNGLPVDRLLKEYTDAEYKPFPYRELGFKSPLDFLRSIPDVAKVVTLRSGHIFVHAVANDNVSHIHELVQGQKKSQGTGFKVFNRLTNGQSDHRKPFLLPTPYNNRNKPNNYSNGGSRNSSYNTNRMNGHKPLPSTSSQLSRIYRTDIPPPPTSYTGFCVENESQLTTEFQNLLQSYPEGIAISNAFGLYSRKYQKPSPIQEPLPLINFFEKHADVFKKWKKDGNTIVALKNPQPVAVTSISEPTSSQPLQVESSSLLGAIPKVFPPPQRMPTPEAVYRPMTETPNQLKWAATDIRVQSPSNKAIQTLTVAWDCNPTPSTTSNPNLRKVTPVSVRFPHRERDIPATFGVRKPQIKNVCEPGSDIPRQEVPPESDKYEYFFIVVAEVYSPGQFYWFLSENRRDIEGLTDAMTAFYTVKPEYAISRSEMYIGQLVAAMYVDNLWYRARIVKCYEDEFEVFYVDYGSQRWVTIDRIRHLDLHFTQLPIQAFCGRICGVRHLPTENKWSTEAGRCFLDLVKGSKTIAAMKMIEKKVEVGENESETVYTLALVDTTAKDKDIHVSDHLIENGFAVVDQEETASLHGLVPSVTTSPDENNSIPIASPSPLPTCAFPLSASNTLAPQLDNGRLSPHLNQMQETSPECFMRNGQASSVISLDNSETIMDEVKALSVSSDRESYRDSQHLVKQIVLSDGRKLHTVHLEGDLYLPKFDLMVLIPNLERQMASFKMGIENKSISVETYPEIFAEMNEAGASWIRDKSQPVTQLILYSLQHVSSLVFLFSPNDKIASAAIVAELKEFNALC